MANSDQSAITGKFTGTINKQLVFRRWEGKTVVAHFPKPQSGEASTAQKEVKSKFFIASRYAKGVANNPDQGLANEYKKMLKVRQNVYSRAMEDFLTPPFVDSIKTPGYSGNIGDKIIIRALDDFRVTEVRVEIYDSNGTLLEAGNTVVEREGIDWSYTATQANGLLAGTRIKAIAIDVPGNEGTLEVIL
jgi:hypothetical protein